jgi:biotin carboxylase
MAGNYVIHVTTSSNNANNIIIKKVKSKSIDEIHGINHDFNRSNNKDALIRIIKKYKIDVILPIESYMELAKIKPALSKFCKVLVEDYEKIDRFHNKRKTILLAREIGIPHPVTHFFRKNEDFTSYAKNTSYPVVIKPAIGTSAKGIRYVRNEKELTKLFREAPQNRKLDDCCEENRHGLLLQEYIHGELEDVTALCLEGHMVLGMTQKRILTKPLSGGIGIVNITTHNEELLNYARKVISHVQWNGVLLFDFKIDDRDGKPKLLEINPRFWGTTWLTIRAGLNYPHYFIQAALGHPIDPPHDYREGLICRWPIREFETIFSRPLTFIEAIERTHQFLTTFRYENCVYEVWSDIGLIFVRISRGCRAFWNKARSIVTHKYP